MQLDLNFVRDQFGQLADMPEFVLLPTPGVATWPIRSTT